MADDDRERRRLGGEQLVDSLPAELRERLAVTAERVAGTFALGARVRAGMAARGVAGEDYYRARAAWNQLVADFERRQAEAIRGGRLLAIPWRPVPEPPAPGRGHRASAAVLGVGHVRKTGASGRA